MTRGAVHRIRVRVAGCASLLSCGHEVQEGEQIVSRNRGPWLCLSCALATRGARTVRQVLADEARR